MGKLTGFMEYERQRAAGARSEDARARLERVPRPPARDDAAGAGRALHGLRRPVLPHGDAARRAGRRAARSTTSSPSGTISSTAASGGGARAPAQDQQLPRVHRARLPGAVRGLVRARHQRAGGHDQEHRGRDHRQGLRGGLGRRRAARASAPARRSRSSARARRASPRAAQLNKAGHSGHRVRARRSHRRPAHVRHPAHEARQARRRPAREADGRGGRQLRDQHRGRQELPDREAARRVRRGRPVRRRDRGARSAGRGAEPRGRPLRDGVPAQERKSLLDSNFADRQFIDAKGKNVIVIGGGDTGTDCVGTSLRHGCKSLVQFEILPRPPDERAADNPWPQWPRVYKLDYGQEEAAALFGADPRRYVTVTKRLVGDAGGNVKELHTVEVEWVKNGDGRFAMKEKPGTEKVWPAELVLLAMGFVGPEKPGLLTDLGVALDGARQRRRRRRQGDQRPGRLRRRRHVARPVAHRLGDPGGARRRPRRRPVPDGRDAAALNCGTLGGSRAPAMGSARRSRAALDAMRRLAAASSVSWSVYLARCADGTLTAGSRSTSTARIAAHDAGKGRALHARARAAGRSSPSAAAARRGPRCGSSTRSSSCRAKLARSVEQHRRAWRAVAAVGRIGPGVARRPRRVARAPGCACGVGASSARARRAAVRARAPRAVAPGVPRTPDAASSFLTPAAAAPTMGRDGRTRPSPAARGERRRGRRPRCRRARGVRSQGDDGAAHGAAPAQHRSRCSSSGSCARRSRSCRSCSCTRPCCSISARSRTRARWRSPRWSAS